MAENITKIKVDDDVRCISLDTEVIDIQTFTCDNVGRLSVRLGSSLRSGPSGIGVKIHPDIQDYLYLEPSGLSLNLSSMADGMAERMAALMMGTLGLVIDSYNNTLKLGTDSLKLGSGLSKGIGNELILTLGSGLEFQFIGKKLRVKLSDQGLIDTQEGGALQLNLEKLYELLEARYNLTQK